MFGLVRKKALIRYMKEIKDENRASNIYAKYPPKDNKQEKLNCYSQGYEDGTHLLWAEPNETYHPQAHE